jgi:hypothetical protein
VLLYGVRTSQVCLLAVALAGSVELKVTSGISSSGQHITRTASQKIHNVTTLKYVCLLLHLAGSVELKVTSGVSSSGKLLKSQLGFPVLRLSQCPNNKCIAGSAPTAAAAAADPAASADAAAAAAPEADAKVLTPLIDNQQSSLVLIANASKPAAAAAAPRTTAGGVIQTGAPVVPASLVQVGSGCSSESKLGYQCSKELAKGVTLHYSLGGEQPSNVCTQKSGYERPGGASKGSMMHFALESDEQVGEQRAYEGIAPTT